MMQLGPGTDTFEAQKMQKYLSIAQFSNSMSQQLKDVLENKNAALPLAPHFFITGWHGGGFVDGMGRHGVGGTGAAQNKNPLPSGGPSYLVK